ncbi:MAG: antibiotic biosynthesis monooxygenase [Porticoccaceae bacterium]|nr:antibiotic biosynthesis monooxygenase [Porticoccaceae bacterium]
MSKIALVVEIDVVEGQMEPFMEALMTHAANSQGDEKGTLNFDVLRGATPGEVKGVLDEWLPSDTNKVWLYELYEDQAAMDIHMEAASLAEYRNKAEDLVKAMKVITCMRVD